jgi:hypothetical protein
MPKAPARLGLSFALCASASTEPGDKPCVDDAPGRLRCRSAPASLDHLVSAHGDRGAVCCGRGQCDFTIARSARRRRRRARWYPPGTPDSLAARKAKVLALASDIVHGKGERWVELTLHQSGGLQGRRDDHACGQHRDIEGHGQKSRYGNMGTSDPKSPSACAACPCSVNMASNACWTLLAHP